MKAAIGCFIGLVFVVSASAEPLLEGRVRLESGEPVADAQVRLFDMTDLRQGAIARAQTDGGGYFALPLAALGGSALPERFTLGPNYPNPFNPSTIIPYQLAASSAVRLEVFNLLGQRIATLVDGVRPAGFHTATWHATDVAGRSVGAGVYIYRMTVGAASQTGRMVLLDGQAGVAAVGSASVWSGASGGGESDGVGEQVYGLIVSGSGLAPYVDSAFRVEVGMAPVELVVSAGQHQAGKATDDDCALCGLFDAFNDEQEAEEAEATEAEEEALIVYASVSDNILTPGQAFTLRARVQNQGADEFQGLVLSYYRSADATISAQDMLLGTDEVGRLAASSTSGNEAISLTASSTYGTYYYGACVASVSDEGDTRTLNCSPGVRVIVADEEDQVVIPDAGLRAAIAKKLGKASGAPITVAEMATLTTLEVVYAGISDLTGLEFATNLTAALLSENRITNVSPLSGLTKLEWLDLFYNNITDVSALRGLTNLTNLELGGNNITDVSALRGLTKLEWLLLGFNNITDVSALRGLTSLTILSLVRNNITDVSALSGLTKLEWLHLDYNNVTDVSALSGLTNLTNLWLEANNVTDVSALSGLPKLRRLYLEFNNVTDVSALRGSPNLARLHLRGNPLSNSSINDHIPALESSGTIVLFDSFRTGDFDIELVFPDYFKEGQKNVLRYAARRWMSVITEDLPNYEFTQGWSGECGDQSYAIPAGERIDDLRIYVTSFDGGGNVFGRGGPRLLRETHLPVLGCMSFDLKWANLWITGLHEMGHVLGFGTIWDEFGYRQNLSWDDSNADTHFNGPLAIAAFDEAGGRDYTGKKVPLQKMDGVHWRYPVLEGDLMLPGGGGALSAITVQSLADLGYGVDVTQADPYTLPGAAAKASAKIAAAMPSILGVDGTQADVYTLSGSNPHRQGKVIEGLPLLPGDDRLSGSLERAEWIGGRDFGLGDNRLSLTGRLAPHSHTEPKPLCGVDLRPEPIHVIDPQGRIVRTLGD